jgi:hypothetical protein
LHAKEVGSMKSNEAYIPLILKSKILKENRKYLLLFVFFNYVIWIVCGIKGDYVNFIIREPLFYFHFPGIIYTVLAANYIVERFMKVFNINLYNSAINTEKSKEFLKIEKILGEKTTAYQEELLNLICNKNEKTFIFFWSFFLILTAIISNFILTKNFGVIFNVYVYPWTPMAYLLNTHIYWLIISILLFSFFWILIGMLRGFKLLRQYIDLMLASGDEDEKLCLFTWDDVPGNDSDKLLKFLRKDRNIGWTHKPEIRKSNDGKTIYISKSSLIYPSFRSIRYKLWRYILVFLGFFQNSLNDEKPVKIVFDEKKEEATLKSSDDRIYNLKVKKKNGKLKIYEKFDYNMISLKNFVFNIKPIMDLMYLMSSLTIIFSFLYSVAVVYNNAVFPTPHPYFFSLLVILGGLSIFLWPQITLHKVLENVRESTLLEYYDPYEYKRMSLWKQTYPIPINKSIYYFYPFFR